MKIGVLILLVGLLAKFDVNAQNNVSIKFIGLSIHPKGEGNAFLMSNKLDENGYLVFNLGGLISYEHFIYKDILSIKVTQALYADCATRLGGTSHIGLRGKPKLSKIMVMI